MADLLLPDFPYFHKFTYVISYSILVHIAMIINYCICFISSHSLPHTNCFQDMFILLLLLYFYNQTFKNHEFFFNNVFDG